MKSLHILDFMNLTFSKRGDYVVRSAICLARSYDSGETRKLREISVEMEVPRTFVSQILGDLVKADLAVSTAGRGGGFRLSRPPEEITILDVVEAGEGSLVSQRCALGDGPCRWDSVCPMHDSWSQATAALRDVLATSSLASLADHDRAIELGKYPIPEDSHRVVRTGIAIHDSVHIELPRDVVASRLRSDTSWLSDHARGASHEEELRVRVGPGGHAWLEKTVVVRLGGVEESDEALIMPIAWEATGPSGLFPRLEGNLTLIALDPERSELSLDGRYRPPLGRTGKAIDETLLSRAAHATIRSFLRRVAVTLEEVSPPGRVKSPDVVVPPVVGRTPTP